MPKHIPQTSNLQVVTPSSMDKGKSLPSEVHKAVKQTLSAKLCSETNLFCSVCCCEDCHRPKLECTRLSKVVPRAGWHWEGSERTKFSHVQCPCFQIGATKQKIDQASLVVLHWLFFWHVVNCGLLTETGWICSASDLVVCRVCVRVCGFGTAT